MTLTGSFDINDIQEELCVYLRNNDILSTSTRGVTTATTEFNGTGAQTTFTIPNTPLRNIRTVTVNGSSKAFGTDYTVNYSTAVVTFLVAPGSGTNNVDITYDYGSTDKIFPDLPRDDLNIASYPRIGIEVETESEPLGIGSASVYNHHLIKIHVFDPNNTTLADYVQSITALLVQNPNVLFNMKNIILKKVDKLTKVEDRDEKIMKRIIEFESRFNNMIVT